ncbi:type II toxin-antitoxin system HipA family toxin [Zafaria sp. J156]|uniref:type II toxin-antitoxin system HipA family toxin n=1 Tax=Zafaria sp. J156 TaxID=3116490 RepID=UPI002E779D63|nr:type II toxin-antitoxin system HipA family toxin [Zafaria sp. J156]MEE1621726.1 type II toxin-antitoxin system HipA family toxin [Zafaria sp. J156]
MSFEVWIDERHVGDCRVDTRPGHQFESLTFTYRDDWLADPRGFAISPDLPLQRGPHTPATHRSVFLAFDDASPDEWGRRLMEADRRRRARSEAQPFKAATEIERLLAVDDRTRQGALRFRQGGVFLAADGHHAGLQDLDRLVRAAQSFADTGEVDDEVQKLICVGSSPGGARPKAWILDPDGHTLLAKFPRTADHWDVSAWELAAILLQKRAGIRTQPSRAVDLGGGRHVFLTRRFDREGGRRIPYLSFRTAFALGPHELPDYATLASRVASLSSRPNEDAAELFSRAAFGVMVNNIDDHMRNHGLLHDGTGWRLAPSFDVNPSRFGTSGTPLTPEDDPADRDVRLLVEHADAFRLTTGQAVERLEAVARAVSGWRQAAVDAGVAPDALDSMSGAFGGVSLERITRLASSRTGGGHAAAGGEVWVRPHVRGGREVDGHFRKRRPR